ncbi:MAG: hypothetical protein IJB88_08055 [Clostridia bacterium]|nr:hypothetical protein [Clostridia bacterium]
MKKYQKPIIVVAKYDFSEHLFASGGTATVKCNYESEYNFTPAIHDAHTGCDKESVGTGMYEDVPLT